MFKILNASKDTYITNKIINGVASVNSNVGKASTLDLYKLYGENTSGSLNQPVVEYTRLLIKFDLSTLRTLISQNKVDVTSPLFNAQLVLFDVYGGQPTPENFTIKICPLSKSFDEGRGKDIVRYADLDACNFITASYPNNTWLLPGANMSGSVPTACDFYTTLSNVNDLIATQSFTTGEENLCVDVTKAISASLYGSIPDEGFRISFNDVIDNDNRTYFVKRFVGRNAYNEDLHPRLIIRYDSSIQDDSQILELDYTNNIFLYNYHFGALQNLSSGSSTLTGSNCVQLKLLTPISGGYYELLFTGSQYSQGINNIVGIYSASVFVPSTNTHVKLKLQQTGSIDFTPVWSSLDNSVTFVSGTTLTFHEPLKLSYKVDHNQYVVTTSGIRATHKTNENIVIRINIFDYTSPLIKFVKMPIELSGKVLRNVHYQVRDSQTGDVIIPFDKIYNSTRASSDNKGMYFELDTSNLKNQRSYVIDIMISTQDNDYIYKNVSNIFQINNLN
jgi:hypothetical protein